MNLLKKLPAGKRARLALAVAVVAVIAWVVHVASGFLHRMNTADFSARTVSLALDSQTGADADGQAADMDGQAAADVYTALTVSNMMPGADAYTGLTIANPGSDGFTYSMSATVSGDNDLASELRIGIAAVPDGSCDSSAYATGTSLLADSTGLSRASITRRSLPGSSTEYLCFHVRLPWGVPNSLQGQSAEATLNFTAQQ